MFSLFLDYFHVTLTENYAHYAIPDIYLIFLVFYTSHVWF